MYLTICGDTATGKLLIDSRKLMLLNIFSNISSTLTIITVLYTSVFVGFDYHFIEVPIGLSKQYY